MIRLVLAFGGNSLNEDPTKVVYCGHSASTAQEKIDKYKGDDDLRITEVPHLRRAKKTRKPEQAPETEPAPDRAFRRQAYIDKAKDEAAAAKDGKISDGELNEVAILAGEVFDSENPESK